MGNRFLFGGYDTLHSALWSTDGTSAGTYRLAELGVEGNDVSLQYPSGANFYTWMLAPAMAFIGSETLFVGTSFSPAIEGGYATSSSFYVTDGTVTGTHVLDPSQIVSPLGAGASADMTAFNGGVVFAGVGSDGQYGLWTTDGTDSGTQEVTVAGAESQGIFRVFSGQITVGQPGAIVFPDFTPFNGKLYFVGEDANSHPQLWVSDGTSAGTSQLAVSNASGSGLFFLTSDAGNESSPDLTVFNNRLWFSGRDASGYLGLWSSDGTAAGTSEMTVPGAWVNGLFNVTASPNFAVYGGRLLFVGRDANANWQLFSTDGTSAGTQEIIPTTAAATGLFTSPLKLNTILPFNADFTAFNGMLLFGGVDAAGQYGLWTTDGTAAGTHEIAVNGANANGVSPENLTVNGNKVLFQGLDAAGVFQLWQTDGTTAGTSIVAPPAGSAAASGIQPTAITLLPAGAASIAALPDVSASVTGAAMTALAGGIATLSPPGTVPTVFPAKPGGVDVVGAGLNAWVSSAPAANSQVTAGALFNAIYLLGQSPATLVNLGTAVGPRLLVSTAPNATIFSEAGDTVVGGNGNETIIASGGTETLAGGTGSNLFVLARATVTAFSQGSDTITGSTGAATITATGSPIYFGGAGSTLFQAVSGSPTLTGGGAETVVAGSATPLVFGPASSLIYQQGSGSGTVVGGIGGAVTATGGTAPLLYFGNGAGLYTPGRAVDTIVGGTGTLTATGGAAGSFLVAGAAGGNRLYSGTGSATILGMASGDVLTATGTGSHVIAAGSGAETIDASASTGNVALFAGGGADCIVGGAGQSAIVAGPGADTLVGGSGVTLFDVAAGGGGRIVVISGFDATHDFVSLPGYAEGAGKAALASATVSGGRLTLTLPDKTQIAFANLSSLPTYSFI